MRGDAPSRALWRRHREALRAFVERRVKDPALADDITHDVLIRALEKQETLRDARKLGAWLYRIARHAIVDHYRRRRVDAPLPEAILSESEDSPEAGRALARCLQPLMTHLPGADRQVLKLVEIEDVPQKEVAARLGISVSGAKSRVQRARRRLADALLACCRIERDARGAIVDYHPQNSSACASNCSAEVVEEIGPPLATSHNALPFVDR